MVFRRHSGSRRRGRVRVMEVRFLKLALFALLLGLVLTTWSSLVLGANTSEVVVIRKALLVEIAPPWDTIDSGVAECVHEAVKVAEAQNAVLIYKVDSYGGYLDAAFTIGDTIYYSKTVTVAYVERKALSAGTLIVLPADYLAVQRGSTLGAMQPVMINPVTGEVEFINESKVVEPIIVKGRVYAEAKGRNATLVEDFVYRARTINSTAAVELRLADAEVYGFEDLVSRLYGLKIAKNGVTYELMVTPKEVTVFACSLRSRALSLLSNSYVSNLLVSIGVLAAIFSLISGRFIVLPLALALILLGLVGVGINPNIVSFVLILMGTVLLAVELFILPGFGFVGISGIVMLTLGFALLPAYIPVGAMPGEEYVNALRGFIIGTSLVLGGFFGIVVFKVIQAKRRAPVSYTPLGKIGYAAEDLKPDIVGYVRVEGEYWRAVSDEEIKAGETIEVTAIRGDGVLVVRRKRLL